MRVWGPLAGRDTVLRRVGVLKTAIVATDPLLLEPEVVTEEASSEDLEEGSIVLN